MTSFDNESEAFNLNLDEHWLAETSPSPVRTLPQQRGAISGKQLRARLITPEAIAAMKAQEPAPSVLQRLLRRK